MKNLYLCALLSRARGLCAVALLTLAVSLAASDAAVAGDLAQPRKNRISISLTGATLDDVLQYVKKETGYYVLYNSSSAKAIKGINIRRENAPVEEVVREALRGTGLDFTINDDTIVIKPRDEKAQTASKTESQSYTRVTVTGKVTNRATKAPVAGAMVLVKGTNVGTVTDEKGAYSIKFPNRPGTVLAFSFLGMESREVPYTNQTSVDVQLLERVESIDDVVVTGYAQVRKEGFTGNTTRISQEDIVKVSPKRMIDAIQVFDPSFRIAENITMGSNPNALPEFYIRGQNSISTELSANTADISRQNLTNNNNLPIFILDGFEVDVEKIYDMDPSRVHSLTLLKDAAATALYGSRAANGVVVIESRAPEPGKLRISYNLTGSVEMPDLSAYNLMNAREKLQAELDGGIYSFDATDFTESVYQKNQEYYAKLNEVNRGVDTYWLSKNLRTAVNHQHSLYIDGGENDVRWGVELKYAGNKGVMRDSKRDTYGAGLFLDYRIGRFQLMNRASYDANNSTDSPYSFSQFSHMLPYNVPIDETTGKYLQKLRFGQSALNPLYEREYLNSFDKSKYHTLQNNFAINFYATPHFTAKAWIAFSQRISDDRTFVDPLSASNSAFATPTELGSLTVIGQENSYYDANILFMYNRNINKNYLNFSLGGNIRETNYTVSSTTYKGFSTGSLNSPNDAAQVDGKPTESKNKTRLVGMFFSANYTYDDIYLLDASVRMDGSSEFGSDNRVAPFWAAGAGINIHNYGFLKGNKTLSRLKIRGSIGTVGKVGYAAYAAQSTYTTSSTSDWYSTGAGHILYYMGNPDLGWEKTRIADIGLELGFFQDRLLFKASYYDKMTIDQITDVTIPSSSGFTSYKDNLGKVSNRGFELDLRYNFYRTRDLDLTLYGNMAHNKNKIIKINDALRAYNELVQKQYDDYDDYSTQSKYAQAFTQYQEGGSMYAIYGMRSLGINPANGKEVYLRPDGTITYEWRAADQVQIGNTEPWAQGSFGLNARWKNFSLFASFLYEFGGQRYNSTLVSEVENANLERYNVDRRVSTDRWKNPGDVTPLKDIKDRTQVTRPTSRFVQDYNTLQFNSLSVSYDFPSKLVKRWGLGMLRLTANMEDLAYISSVLQERGLSYPYSRVMNFTLNLTF